MKKLILSLICVLMLCTLASTAFAACPGSTVTVSVYLTHNGDFAAGTLNLSWPKGILTCQNISVSGSGYGEPSSGIIVLDGNQSSGSKVATVTFEVKESASGAYNVGVSVSSAFDNNEGSIRSTVSASVSGGSGTIGHNFEKKSETPATCDDAAVIHYECSSCPATEDKPGQGKLGHLNLEWVETTPATCTTPGAEKQYCHREGCKANISLFPYGEYVDMRNTNPLNHLVVDVAGTEATCTTPGVTPGKKCDRPGCNWHEGAEPIAALNHDEMNFPGTPATCTTPGTTDGKKCRRCEWTEGSEPIAALNHDMQDVAAKDPTCAEPGNTAYKKCSRCEYTEGYTELPAANHDPETIEAQDPTCTVPGRTGGVRCKKCEEWITESTEIPATNHAGTIEILPARSATCVATGLTEGKHCTACNTDVVPQTEIPINPSAHKPSDDAERDEPTCTEPGSISYVCTLCRQPVDSEPIPALDHDWGEWYTVTPVGCVSDGEKRRDCQRDNCNAFESEVISQDGHAWGEWKETTPADCDSDGEKRRDCDICDAFETDVIPQSGHAWGEWKETTPAACGSDGEKRRDCDICDAFETDVIPQSSHAWGEWKETTPAACDTDGEKRRDCASCDAFETAAIPMTDHTPGEWIVTVPVTDNAPGEKELYCTQCGALLETAVIPNSTYYHMTVSSVGPRFRDISNLTNKWNMFSMVDISADGKQVFDLIAGNIHIVGKMTVTVEDGFLTISYKLFSKEVSVKSELLCIFPGLEAVTTLNADALEANTFLFGKPISIEDDLGGDTTILIYVNNACHYSDDLPGLKDFNDKSLGYFNAVQDMYALMD